MKLLTLFLLLFLGTITYAQNGPADVKLANLGELVIPVRNDTIPIKIWNDYVLLKVKVNGIESDFLWDNGFSFSALEQSLVNSYKLKTLPEIDSLSVTDAVNKKVNLNLKIADMLSFGNTSIKNSPFLVTDMRAFFGQSSQVKGIMGASAIKKLNWKFNFDENYVVVSDKPFDEVGKILPFKLNPYNQLTIDLQINGHTAPAEVDFGMNSDDLEISIGAMQLFEKNLKSPTFGIGGASVSGSGEVGTSYTVRGFDYSLYNDQKFDFPFEINLSPNERGARFGNRFFRYYNPIINFSTSEIKLLKRLKPLNQFPAKSYGFVVMKINQQLQIILKSKNSNTEKYTQLKVGDVIKAVDGKSANAFQGNLDLRNYQLDKLSKNEEISLTTVNGNVIKLKPAENIFK